MERENDTARIPSRLAQAAKTWEAINHAELARFVAVYQRPAALRASSFEINFGAALALFFLYALRIAFRTETKTKRGFPVIVGERDAATRAKRVLRPL
jgi:hypothetical protein